MIESPAISDSELAQRCQRGDLDAFEDLVRRHQGVVYRVAARIVGRDEARDISQDAFLRAYNRIEYWQERGSFRSWLLQITRNAALNHLARRRPQPRGAAEDLEENFGSGEGPDPYTRTPASALEDRERRERLELKLRDLRDEHRIVLVLRDLEGLSYAEIAEVMSSPVGSVKGRLHRARSELIATMRANTYDWELPE